MLSFNHQASYGVEDCEYAVTQLAQTTMRSELGTTHSDQLLHIALVRMSISIQNQSTRLFENILGKITLDKIFQERTSLNSNIVSKYTGQITRYTFVKYESFVSERVKLMCTVFMLV
jgi:regulator of protease activity HflC (stomatin/prohibitin superfamily)